MALLGADPSAAMLAEARAKGIGSLARASVEALPLAAGSVDLVSCSYCFHQFDDKDRALDEIDRVLTAAGRFRMTNLEPGAAGGWWVYDHFPEAAALDAARFWPPDRIAAALEARGFTVEVDVSAARRRVPALEAVADAERRVISQLALLDDDAYGRGLAGLQRAAAVPGATVPSVEARLQVTARRRA